MKVFRNLNEKGKGLETGGSGKKKTLTGVYNVEKHCWQAWPKLYVRDA